jgi:acyl-CoA synthetase (AMP-forming)/AMP-acid ligase II
VLYQHPEVAEVAAIGVPDPLLGEDIVAFVDVGADSSATADTLKVFCQGRIAAFKQAKKIYLLRDLTGLAEIPKGPTKKVLYRELRRYHAEHLADDSKGSA